MNQISRPKLI